VEAPPEAVDLGDLPIWMPSSRTAFWLRAPLVCVATEAARDISLRLAAGGNRHGANKARNRLRLP
jgi:hypothetical protein